MEKIEWTLNSMRCEKAVPPEWMGEKAVSDARRFHRSFPQYRETPLVSLQEMSRYLGVGQVLIKDESYRFGLNAFKVLGGCYAMARYISKESGIPMERITYESLTDGSVSKVFGQAVFYTATDGNHGRGIAWAANRLGQRAVVYMPKGTTVQRLENIRRENAEVTIEDANYDECVRMAAEHAAQTEHGVVIQDTAWDGYEEIPKWIMEGYGTMALEAREQFEQASGGAPTHIMVQAGVGSLAGAILGFFTSVYRENPPRIIVCEAREADCIYRSARKGTGEIAVVGGDMPTIMAGLACGEPNPQAWNILKTGAYAFLSCEDSVARLGMRMLAAPLKGDCAVVSGESGALPFGALATIMRDKAYTGIREALGLSESSRVLCFSTEGDTDPDRYRRIVWSGLDQ